uniref:Cytochrome P450 n=1 Tax=Strigamia maritima TaxID=126957 RepID=T1IKZ0_STRMM
MSIVLSISLVGIALLLYTVTILVRKSRFSSKSTKSLKVLPGPREWPIIGSALTMAKYTKPWEGFSALRKVYGDIYGMRIAVALCDWSEKQKKRRDITFPFTHPRSNTFGLEQLETCIEVTIKDILDQIHSLNGSQEGSHDALLFTSANLFYHFLCSKRFDYKDPKFIETIENYHSIFCDLFCGYSLDFFPWIRFFNDNILVQLNKLSQQVSSFTEPIFEEHRESMDEEKPRDLVDVLLATRPSLSWHDSMVIVEDLVGGHSAMHNMWMWLLALVGVNPRVAMRIREEAEKADEDESGLKLKHRSQLVYTEATINEALRVVASPIIPHRSTKSTCIQGYDIPEDTLVFFNTCDLNMDETLWSEPTKFKPERFLRDDETRVFKPDYFIPFGTGKRSCLGDGIVRATLLLGLATLVRQFDIDVPTGSQLLDLKQLPGTVLWPQNDIKVRFTARNSTPT